MISRLHQLVIIQMYTQSPQSIITIEWQIGPIGMTTGEGTMSMLQRQVFLSCRITKAAVLHGSVEHQWQHRMSLGYCCWAMEKSEKGNTSKPMEQVTSRGQLCVER